MRVVVVSQWFPPEKATIQADIAATLVKQGHEVTVLTGFPNYPSGKIFEGWRQRAWLDQRKDGYDIRRVALYPSHDRSALRRTANYLSFGVASTIFGWKLLRRADVIYIYHPPLTAALGPWISRLLRGAPYVLHIQDLWPESVLETGLLKGRAAAAAGRLLTVACDATYRRAAGIICIAPTMAALLHERGVLQESLHVVPNWADEALFYPSDRDDRVAKEHGLNEHFTVMFAGNIGDIQGLDVAIRAAAAASDLTDFRLVIVGDGVARASLQMLAVELSCENVVFLTSQPVEAMNALSQAADVQLVSLRDLPFLAGTIPSKLGTVLAMGLPVICSVAGDAQQLVKDAGAGWTCAPGDVGSLEKAFREAHASTVTERQGLGASGRLYYSDHLSRNVSTAQIATALGSASHT